MRLQDSCPSTEAASSASDSPFFAVASSSSAPPSPRARTLLRASTTPLRPYVTWSEISSDNSVSLERRTASRARCCGPARAASGGLPQDGWSAPGRSRVGVWCETLPRTSHAAPASLPHLAHLLQPKCSVRNPHKTPNCSVTVENQTLLANYPSRESGNPSLMGSGSDLACEWAAAPRARPSSTSHLTEARPTYPSATAILALHCQPTCAARSSQSRPALPPGSGLVSRFAAPLFHPPLSSSLESGPLLSIS